MRLYVHRDSHAPGMPTMGRLYIDGRAECETLEDEYRGDDPAAKVKGDTAIPCGTYPLFLTWSPRFGRVLPLVENVPGFKGIRIHTGNDTDDTEGCLLVGTARAMVNGVPSVIDSRTAFARLFAKLTAYMATLPKAQRKTGLVGTITYSLTPP